MRTKRLDMMSFFLSVLIVMLSFVACGGPSEQRKALEEAGLVEPVRASPEAAAKVAFEIWAQQAGTPYRNARYDAIYNDGTFATMHIMAEFKESPEEPWLEHKAKVECKKVGEQWQCESWMHFQLTAEERAKLDAAATATRATIEAMAALEATATAIAEAQATATAIAQALQELESLWGPQALQELESLWGPSSKCQNGRVVINCNVVVFGTEGEGVRLREGVGYNSPTLAILDEGAFLRILGGPEQADGSTWWQVGTRDGVKGWYIADYIHPLLE